MCDSTDNILGLEALIAEQRFNVDIVVGDLTQALLRPRGLLPSQWRIPDAERQRIKKANIKLAIVFPPASELSFTIPGGSRTERIHVVTVDLKTMDAYALTQREIVALILHEIGHVVNPRQEAGLLREMYADDYARLCGFGPEISSSLSKCSQYNPQDFEEGQIRERVQRTVNNTENTIEPYTA